MKILSLNVWGGQLYSPLLSYLRTVDADIVCLQEVARAPTSTADWLLYQDGQVTLDQRARLYDEIAAVLPGHDGLFTPTLRGELMEGDRPCPQFFGLATFWRKSIPLIGCDVGFVHEDFSPHDFGQHPRARNAVGLSLYDYAIDRPFTVVQMHGLRDPAGKHDTPARAAQANALSALIKRVAVPGAPLVVCGDFNLLPESATFTALQAQGLTDLVTTSGFNDTRTSHYTKPVRYADYMLVNEAVAVRRFDVVTEPEVSDHRALLLETD